MPQCHPGLHQQQVAVKMACDDSLQWASTGLHFHWLRLKTFFGFGSVLEFFGSRYPGNPLTSYIQGTVFGQKQILQDLFPPVTARSRKRPRPPGRSRRSRRWFFPVGIWGQQPIDGMSHQVGICYSEWKPWDAMRIFAMSWKSWKSQPWDEARTWTKKVSRNGNDHCKDQEFFCRYFRVLVGMALSENEVPHIFIFTDKNLYIPIHIALSETKVPYNSMVSHHLFRLNPLFSIIENLKLSKLKLMPMLKLLFNTYTVYIYTVVKRGIFSHPPCK